MQQQHVLPAVLGTLLAALHVVGAEILVNRTGCGTTKVCIFRPRGCNPNLDCTMGAVVSVVGANQMRVQMVAQTILPPVPQQYVAIAFSHDMEMGNDSVTECVLSESELSGEPEIYLSYNKGKANDRVFLDDNEHNRMFTDVASEVTDGRLACEFTQQLVPQFDDKNGLVWTLDKHFFMFVATGSAQPDEINAHDTNKASHFYPAISEFSFTPTNLNAQFVHPRPFAPPPPPTKRDRVRKSSGPPSFAFFAVLCCTLFFLI